MSGGTIGGFYEEISLGSGLAINGNTISAPAFPPPSVFKNLVIKVTGNTTATATADFVTTTNGTLYQTTPLSCPLNMASTGAGGLDTGSITQATWYAVWQIAKSDGTTSCVASLQFTANGTFIGNLPSGYTYYARIGALRTSSGIAQLMGTWQFGRRTQYVVGLAQTSVLPNIANGTAGAWSQTTPTWALASVSSFVPPTASYIRLLAAPAYGNNASASLLIAPNANYSGVGSNNPPPYSATDRSNNGFPTPAIVEFMLEGSVIAWVGGGASAAINCLGWEDNI